MPRGKRKLSFWQSQVVGILLMLLVVSACWGGFFILRHKTALRAVEPEVNMSQEVIISGPYHQPSDCPNEHIYMEYSAFKNNAEDEMLWDGGTIITVDGKNVGLHSRGKQTLEAVQQDLVGQLVALGLCGVTE